ncbi:hypothetical protein GCM10027347_59300 [Larkinella harenae]
MATTLPPQRKRQPTEAEIESVILKGGSTIQEAAPDTDDAVKHFNVRLTAGTLKTIEGLRTKRPRRLGSRKPGISTHEWMIEAVLEKIEREKRKYKE